MIVLKYIQVISTCIAVLLIPVILGIQSNSYTKAIKEKEKQLRFVELAIDILNSKDSSTDSALRQWAIETLNKYSEVPFSESVQKDLIDDKIKLPLSKSKNTVKTNTQSALIDELSKKKLLHHVCDATNMISNTSPSPNAAQLACEKFKEVIMKLPASVFSNKYEDMIELANRQFKAKNFAYASFTYKILFNECYEYCKN